MQLQRFFSACANVSRQYAHVVRRRVKQPRLLKPGDPDTLLKAKKPEYPPYPYGPATYYKQSNRGLYGAKVLQFGHQISEYGNKHVRIFRPNVQRVTLYSEALKRRIRMPVVASVLRTISKQGGLDNYLIKDQPARIKELGPYGWKLRYDVLKVINEHERTRPPVIETHNDKPIYARIQLDGEFFGVAVGRTRLVKLYQTTLKEAERENLQTLLARFKETSFEELVKVVKEAGVSLDNLLVKL